MKMLGIEVSFEEFDYLMCQQSEGKELKVVNGKVVAVDRVLTKDEINQSKIAELKQELIKWKEDVEQVELFGMERTDYEQKKARCAEIILILRQLEKEL